MVRLVSLMQAGKPVAFLAQDKESERSCMGPVWFWMDGQKAQD